MSFSTHPQTRTRFLLRTHNGILSDEKRPANVCVGMCAGCAPPDDGGVAVLLACYARTVIYLCATTAQHTHKTLFCMIILYVMFYAGAFRAAHCALCAQLCRGLMLMLMLMLLLLLPSRTCTAEHVSLFASSSSSSYSRVSHLDNDYMMARSRYTHTHTRERTQTQTQT